MTEATVEALPITSQEVVDKAVITYRQLDYWVRKGYLTPLPRQKEQTGFDREFTEAEQRVAVRMARLIRAGFTPKAAAVIARADVEVIKLQRGITLRFEDAQ